MPAKAYELLLLGTIADVVPLVKENRFWVRHGLQYINSVESKSLQVLKANGKVTRPVLSATDIGFSIAPQINALGRLEDPRQGVKFLIGSDSHEVQQVGKILAELNDARKAIERSIFESIQKLIESKTIDLEKERVIVASSDSWPPGVIGLVASRLVSMYGRPTLLFHITREGIAKGSCRSIKEFNMFDALQANQQYIEQFGGHSQAAGLSIKVENLPKLKQALEERVASQLTDFDLKQKLVLDAYASLTDFNQKFMHDLSYLEPFGHANQAPVFLVDNVVLVQKPVLLKDAHVKCMVFADGIIKPVIFFNRPELFPLLSECSDSFKLVAQVVENHWNGRTNIELTGVDIAL
jgi:single-stranded-DNA-specific exonuclease